MSSKSDSDRSLKLAIAMALLKTKLLQKPQPQPPPPPPPPPAVVADFPSTSYALSHSDALEWKRKAKERKLEIVRLTEDLKAAEGGVRYELFPQIASCKCYFFDNLGSMSHKGIGDACDQRFNDVLRRRFLRQVRLKERRKRRRDASSNRPCISEFNEEDETEQLRASVDFLVELCGTASSMKEDTFANWSHQAVDFILDALRNLVQMKDRVVVIEGIVNCLVTQLVTIMCNTSQGDELHSYDTDAQFSVQHLIRKLGSDPFIGQRVILLVSQQISLLAESLLFMDPFNAAFPSMHSCMYIMIQLIEFLVADYLLTWSSTEGFDLGMFEEWVSSVLHAYKALDLLESRNTLYVLYMDRVIGDITKKVSQVSLLQKLNSDILNKLFS